MIANEDSLGNRALRAGRLVGHTLATQTSETVTRDVTPKVSAAKKRKRKITQASRKKNR